MYAYKDCTVSILQSALEYKTLAGTYSVVSWLMFAKDELVRELILLLLRSLRRKWKRRKLTVELHGDTTRPAERDLHQLEVFEGGQFLWYRTELVSIQIPEGTQTLSSNNVHCQNNGVPLTHSQDSPNTCFLRIWDSLCQTHNVRLEYTHGHTSKYVHAFMHECVCVNILMYVLATTVDIMPTGLQPPH